MWIAAILGLFLVLDGEQKFLFQIVDLNFCTQHYAIKIYFALPAEYHCDQSSEVEKHLEMGRLMLARNQLQDALTHYHAAVGEIRPQLKLPPENSFSSFFYLSEGDPRNYLTFFKRATVYLALGKAKFALADLEKVLELKPDFTAVSHVALHLTRNKNSFPCS